MDAKRPTHLTPMLYTVGHTLSCLLASNCPFFQNRERFSERIGNVADKVEHCDVHMNHGAGASVSGYLVADSATSKPKEESALSKTTHGR